MRQAADVAARAVLPPRQQSTHRDRTTATQPFQDNCTENNCIAIFGPQRFRGPLKRAPTGRPLGPYTGTAVMGRLLLPNCRAKIASPGSVRHAATIDDANDGISPRPSTACRPKPGDMAWDACGASRAGSPPSAPDALQGLLWPRVAATPKSRAEGEPDSSAAGRLALTRGHAGGM